MSRYHGEFGFVTTKLTAPGVYSPLVITRSYQGEIYNITRRNQQINSVNDDISFSMEVSVIADPYLYEEIGYLKYITYRDQKWKVDSVRYEHPRIILSINSLYKTTEE